jgi:hypothetical protein
MNTIGTFLFFAVAAASWILPPSALGVDIRIADGIRIHYETSGTDVIPNILQFSYEKSM